MERANFLPTSVTLEVGENQVRDDNARLGAGILYDRNRQLGAGLQYDIHGLLENGIHRFHRLKLRECLISSAATTCGRRTLLVEALAALCRYVYRSSNRVLRCVAGLFNDEWMEWWDREYIGMHALMIPELA